MKNEELKTAIESLQNGFYEDFAITFEHEDVIDSRDIQEKIDELEGEFNGLLKDYEDAGDEDEQDEAEENLENWMDEYANEYAGLLLFKELGDTSEWQYGETFIKEDYFEDYARQLAEDCGMLKDCGLWPLNCIDWERATRELKYDYSELTIDGETYYFRNC